MLGAVAIFVALIVGAQPVLADGSARMTKTRYGRRWPLTLRAGVVHCQRLAVTFTAPDGRTYAINRIATSAHRGRNVDPIWRRAPHGSDRSRLDITPIIDRGLKLCGVSASRPPRAQQGTRISG